MRLIMEGRLNADVLERVKAVYPRAKTTMKCIYWYRNKLRKTGKGILTQTELKDKLREEILGKKAA